MTASGPATYDALRDAIERVAAGEEQSLVLRSSGSRRAWVQVSRVDGEDALLCEAVSNEYRPRYRQLSTTTVTQLDTLGWRSIPEAPFVRWEQVRTPAERDRLTCLLERTLVEAFGHDPTCPPRIAPP